MALYTPHSIFHLARLLYVRPETFGPYYVSYMARIYIYIYIYVCVCVCSNIYKNFSKHNSVYNRDINTEVEPQRLNLLQITRCYCFGRR